MDRHAGRTTTLLIRDQTIFSAEPAIDMDGYKCPPDGAATKSAHGRGIVALSLPLFPLFTMNEHPHPNRKSRAGSQSVKFRVADG